MIWLTVLTVSRCIHDNEARVDFGSSVPILEVDGVGVASETGISLVKMDFMVGALQRP